MFNGKIFVFVRKDAQKTNAKQTNRNLLLSDDAVIDTKPQLEIFADDVKCTHGATIGQLDEKSLFYLQARGIPKAMARRMLIYAFASEVIDRITLPQIREELDKVLLEKICAVIVMNDDLNELYQQVILDHSRKPRNFGKLAGRQSYRTGQQTRFAAT